MIQLQHIPEDFPEDWEGFSEEVKDSIKNGELWSDTEWETLEAARAMFSESIFREITINS